MKITVTKDGDLDQVARDIYRATAEGFPDLVEWAETKEEAIELIKDSIATLRKTHSNPLKDPVVEIAKNPL